jgi:hypothetical protein
MKRFLAFTALAAAVAVGSTALAGPGPGLPSFGDRVTDPTDGVSQTDRSRDDDAPYALTGAEGRARRGAAGPTLVQHYGRGGQKAGADLRTDDSSTN